MSPLDGGLAGDTNAWLRRQFAQEDAALAASRALAVRAALPVTTAVMDGARRHRAVRVETLRTMHGELVRAPARVVRRRVPAARVPDVIRRHVLDDAMSMEAYVFHVRLGRADAEVTRTLTIDPDDAAMLSEAVHAVPGDHVLILTTSDLNGTFQDGQYAVLQVI